MRITGPDVALFVVGLLLFSGATLALYQQGGFSAVTQPGSALNIFNVRYTTSQAALEPVAVQNMRTASAAFDVNQTDVARVFVRVQCNPDQAAAAAPFAVAIDVAGPNGLTGQGGGNCSGNAIEIPINVTAVPAGGAVEGGTQEEARANLPRDANATRAQGTWTITIAGSRSAPGGVGPIPQDPTPAPGGSVTLAVERWTAELAPVQR